MWMRAFSPVCLWTGIWSGDRPQATGLHHVKATEWRVQRMLIRLQRYDLKMIYTPGKYMFAADVQLTKVKKQMTGQVRSSRLMSTWLLPPSLCLMTGCSTSDKGQSWMTQWKHSSTQYYQVGQHRKKWLSRTDSGLLQSWVVCCR